MWSNGNKDPWVRGQRQGRPLSTSSYYVIMGVAVFLNLFQCHGVIGQMIPFSAQDLDTPPLILTLPDKNVALQVGENKTFSIIATSTYPTVFNASGPDTTLVFLYSVPQEGQVYVTPLPNVTLGPEFNSSALLRLRGRSAGRLVISSKIVPSIQNYTTDDLFLRISVYKIAILNIICDVVGWIYFAAWSISFYPQIFQNFQRKSVRGLSFEFVFLNVTGFLVYSIYNIGLYWVTPIQDEYYAEDPTGSIPVQMNDVVFSIHALIASGLTGIQCIIYDRGSQTISYTGRSLLCGIGTFLFIILVVTLSSAITWLTFLNFCSYVKLFITLIKYVPQAYLNYTRKSTSGWCIGNVLLDFTGGSFSMIQMLLIAFNHDDWYSIFGDFTKFGLGLFSITFDIFFIVQHYVLYRNHREYEPIEGSPDPILNPHEDMTTSNHITSSIDENNEGQGGQGQPPRSASIDSLRQPLERYQNHDDEE